MQSDFERIKERLPLLQTITQETGLAMKGPHLEQCPFCGGHECFSVKEERYKCFQCDKAGDVFAFLQDTKSMDAGESLKYAAGLAGIQISSKVRPEPKLSTRERIFIETAKHYHGHMLDNGGKEYLLKQRGHKEEVVKKMLVGWTDGGLVDHLRVEGFTDDEITKSGMSKVFQSNGADHLVDYFVKDVAIFPHFEKDRVLHFTIKDPQKKFKYQLPEKERIKDWRFYNQDALTKFNEIIVVEGENDLLSIMDADIQHVIGLIGQPAEYQLKTIQTHCRQKHLYLWLDNDDAGKGFIRKICNKVNTNIRIISYPQGIKDPDEYLKKFDGDRRKEIKRLQEEALDYISWEIFNISRLDSLEDRLKALKDRKIFTYVADMVEAEKLVFIEKLTSLGFTKTSVEEQLETNYDLKNKLAVYFERVPKKDADPNYIASEIFKNLSDSGRFYHDKLSNVYLLHHHHIYQIGNNRPFNAIIKKLTGLLPTKEPGRSVWESLASEAYNSGIQIDLASWIYTDRASDTVYVNLNSPNNGILKISRTGVEEIPNGINKEGVLLKSSRKIMPFNYHPDVDIREGMTALKELMFDNLACEKEQRYLILCWFVSAFLLDLSPYMGLMHFTGASNAGKTTAARLISLIIYGNEHLGDPTAASAYAIASQNPLLIIDNLESDDFTKSILKFLLLSATKGGKEKRTQGTDSDTIQEQPKALVLVTAIEPFIKSELINRTFDIDFNIKFKSDGFIEDDAIRSIIKKRDLILSAILKFISRDVLPNLESRKDNITVLKKEYKNHAKNRTDEYLALLMLILDKILAYLPYYASEDFLYGVETGKKDIHKAWIDYQNAKARDTETSSNSIIKLLDGVVREYMARMKELTPQAHRNYPDEDVFAYTHPDFHLEVIKTKARMYCSGCHKLRDVYADEIEKCECSDAQAGEIYSRSFFEFTATSGDMVHAFDRYCRNNGIKNPFEAASIFGSRLNNDRHLLRKYGWDLITKNDDNLFFKTIHGNRFYRFRKVIIQ